MPLKADSWPHFYFLDVSTKGELGFAQKIKVHKDHVKLKTGSTKGRGPGKYYAIVAKGQNSNGNDIYKFTSEVEYEKLKKKMAKSESMKSPKKSRRSPKKSKCNMKLKPVCKKSKTCSWVKGVRGVRKGYCRKSPK